MATPWGKTNEQCQRWQKIQRPSICHISYGNTRLARCWDYPGSPSSPTEGESFSVEIVHTNPKETGLYEVGEKLTFKYRVENLNDQIRSISREDSNLQGDTACKWTGFPAGATQECTFDISHTVTEQDLEAGSFVLNS